MTSAWTFEWSAWNEVAGFGASLKESGDVVRCSYCRAECSNHWFHRFGTDTVECFRCHNRAGGVDRWPPRDPPEDWHCAGHWPEQPAEREL